MCNQFLIPLSPFAEATHLFFRLQQMLDIYSGTRHCPGTLLSSLPRPINFAVQGILMFPSNPRWKTRLHSSTPNPQGNCLVDPTCICKLNSLETRVQQDPRHSTYGVLWDFFSLLHIFFWGGKQHCRLEMGGKLFPILWTFSEISASFHSMLGQRKQQKSSSLRVFKEATTGRATVCPE